MIRAAVLAMALLACGPALAAEMQSVTIPADGLDLRARLVLPVGTTVAPAIVALRSHVANILDNEIARVRAHGDEAGKVETALRHLVGVLLHTPSAQARELAREGRGEEFVAGIETLFGIHPMPQSDAESADDAATA